MQELNIQLKQLREWISKKQDLINMSSRALKLHKERLPKYSQLENALFDWVTSQQQLHNPVT